MKKELTLDQRCSRLVSNEVIYCVSSLFWEIRETVPDEWKEDHWTLTGCRPEPCGCDMDEEEKAERLEEGEPLDPCGSCDMEILEQWIVSRWLGEELAARGEVVAEFMGLNVWGRCTSGQMIAADGIIEDITKERDL